MFQLLSRKLSKMILTFHGFDVVKILRFFLLKIALKLLWNCSEIALKLFWNYERNQGRKRSQETPKSPQLNPKLLQNCSTIAPQLLQNCSEVALKLRKKSGKEMEPTNFKIALELLWNCSEIALKLLWNYKINPRKKRSQQTSKLIWNCSGIALELLWNCSEVGVWDAVGIFQDPDDSIERCWWFY